MHTQDQNLIKTAGQDSLQSSNQQTENFSYFGQNSQSDSMQESFYGFRPFQRGLRSVRCFRCCVPKLLIFYAFYRHLLKISPLEPLFFRFDFVYLLLNINLMHFLP